jgi:hypothetical protein
VDVAQYAIYNQIEHEPAFEWCERGVLKTKTRLIKTMKKCYVCRGGFKFGIQIPSMVEEALALDEANGNDFWLQAIIKEMSNVRIAFDVINKDDSPPVGCLRIPCHMIFNIKMIFTH